MIGGIREVFGVNLLLAGVAACLLVMAFHPGAREKWLGWKPGSALEARLCRVHLPYWPVFFLILLTGLAVRIYRFGVLPYGSNQDGIRAGVESFFLLRNGVDSAGNSWPTYFEAWKYTNMSTLYSYLLIPFLKGMGLSILSLRLPMLLICCGSLLILWDLTRRLSDRNCALMVLLVAALNPWHIMMSRWAIESNLMPHVFLLAVYLMVIGLRHRPVLFLSMAVFGLVPYAYGPSAFFVPVFLLIMAFFLVGTRKIGIGSLIVCFLVFGAVAWAYYMTLAINVLGLESMRIGPFTLPSLPLSNRSTEISLASKEPLAEMGEYFLVFLRHFFQIWPEHSPYDAVNWADALFRFTSVFYTFGFFWMWKRRRVLVARGEDSRFQTMTMILFAWLAGAAFCGSLVFANIIRINCLYYVLILALGVTLYQMSRRLKTAGAVAMAMIIGCFPFFVRDYFGEKQQSDIAAYFHKGLYQALVDTRNMDYDNYYLCFGEDVEQRILWPQLVYAHEIDYDAFTEKTYLTGSKGNLTDWYYTERYQFVTDPETFEADPYACAVYVCDNLEDYRKKFPEEEYEIREYDYYFTAYPRYWMD